MKFVYETLFELMWPAEEGITPVPGAALKFAKENFNHDTIKLLNVLGVTGPPRQLVIRFSADELGTRPLHKIVATEREKGWPRIDGVSLDLSSEGLEGRSLCCEGGPSLKSYFYDVFETFFSTDWEDDTHKAYYLEDDEEEE